MLPNPYPDPNHPLPRPIMVGGGAMMICTVLLAAAAHATGFGVTHNPVPVAVQSRDLLFNEQDDGFITIRQAGTGEEVGRIAPGEGGFIRASMRGLMRNRTRYGEPPDGAFRVTRTADGDVWLQDLSTKQDIELQAFGPNQVQAFAAYLPPREPAR